jgi:hypothetical protein
VSDHDALRWRTASFCHPSGCVEVAVTDDSVYVRNSRNPSQEPLIFDYSEWHAFVRGVRNYEFDVALTDEAAGA